MSTRANIIIKDDYGKLYFYRHSDGYPEGTMPTLNKFLELVKTDKIRDNVGQSAGWLIVIGAIEFQTVDAKLFDNPKNKFNPENVSQFSPGDWQVGAYEPTTGIHGDIEYLYVIDLDTKEIIQVPESDWDKW